MKTVIKNANIILETGIIWDGVIITENEVISDFGKCGEIEIPDDSICVDALGAYVGPGFCDIHVHGGGGYDLTQNPVEGAKFFLENGTTSILPAPPYELNFKQYIEATRNIRAAMKLCPQIKGMYMEGPYINVKYGAYAHLNPWKHPICPDEYKRLVDEAGEDVRVWVVAPEREGIEDFMNYAKKVNPSVAFSVGHSEASPSQISSLGKNRPLILTHAMDATGQGTVPSGTRGCGPDEYCMTEPSMYAELISDSSAIHVNPELQRLLVRTKGTDKIILITDSCSEDMPNPDNLKHIDDLCFDDKGGLAGSKMTMNKACRNIMSSTNCGIAQAFLMASTNPAKAVGLYDEVGSIDVGKKADLVFVDDRFNVKKVMLCGQFVK